MGSFERQPPSYPEYKLSVPRQGVILVTLNRPKQLNSIHSEGHYRFHELFNWFETEPTLQVAILTGSGDKSFCAGQDLIDWKKNAAIKPVEEQFAQPPSGFGGVSQRKSKKVIIAAVNGYCFGGGVEMILNCDMVVASPKATFALPEVQRGLHVAAGGLARLASIVGMPVASELALTGRRFTPEEAVQWKLINRVTKTHESLLPEAIKLAVQVADISPDALRVTKAGLREYWEDANVFEATRK
ncbi:hypothetical protein KEM56_000691 [Ascosphaera pollenicola]|nr:hypothetical protein KEM56_000691 [Ascosphaera pollenicola]